MGNYHVRFGKGELLRLNFFLRSFFSSSFVIICCLIMIRFFNIKFKSKNFSLYCFFYNISNCYDSNMFLFLIKIYYSLFNKCNFLRIDNNKEIYVYYSINEVNYKFYVIIIDENIRDFKYTVNYIEKKSKTVIEYTEKIIKAGIKYKEIIRISYMWFLQKWK